MLIKESNRGKIEKMIKEAEGRSRERTINFDDILWAINKIECKLDIPKTHMEGIAADVDVNAQNFPKAYKYTPKSTQFYMVKKKSGWDLVNVVRDITNGENRGFHLKLTDKAKEVLISRHSMFQFLDLPLWIRGGDRGTK